MLDGREFCIVPDDVLLGTTATYAGHHGSLVIRCWLASVLGLLPRQQDAGSTNASAL